MRFWYLGVLALLGCEEEAAATYCEAYVSRMRACGALGEGRYEACTDYLDDAEACELDCVQRAGCEDFTRCPVPLEEFELSSLDVCYMRCVGLAPYECADGRRLSPLAECDGLANCTDGEDETNCEVAESRFKCRNVDEVIPYSQVCDDAEDCGDGSDELDCEVLVECDAEFGPLKVTRWSYCNGTEECPDGSDEPEGCAESLLQCSSE